MFQKGSQTTAVETGCVFFLLVSSRGHSLSTFWQPLALSGLNNTLSLPSRSGICALVAFQYEFFLFLGSLCLSFFFFLLNSAHPSGTFSWVLSLSLACSSLSLWCYDLSLLTSSFSFGPCHHSFVDVLCRILDWDRSCVCVRAVTLKGLWMRRYNAWRAHVAYHCSSLLPVFITLL